MNLICDLICIHNNSPVQLCSRKMGAMFYLIFLFHIACADDFIEDFSRNDNQPELQYRHGPTETGNSAIIKAVIVVGVVMLCILLLILVLKCCLSHNGGEKQQQAPTRLSRSTRNIIQRSAGRYTTMANPVSARSCPGASVPSSSRNEAAVTVHNLPQVQNNPVPSPSAPLHDLPPSYEVAVADDKKKHDIV